VAALADDGNAGDAWQGQRLSELENDADNIYACHLFPRKLMGCGIETRLKACEFDREINTPFPSLF
jgi:hypothetical protein